MAVIPEQRSIAETKRLARLSGAVYAALGVATAFGFYHTPLVLDDPAAIARAISIDDLRFRLGVLSDVVATVLSVPLVLLLYRLFEPVNKTLAGLMRSFGGCGSCLWHTSSSVVASYQVSWGCS